MLEAFQKFIKEQQLFQSNHKILLAVSGGIDSIVLVHLFKKSNLNFGIAHCNFSLRGSESDQDQIFVEKLSAAYQVPFFSIQFDTKKEASEKKISIQMAARELRYEWFNHILIRENYHWLAAAHHGNDVLETILLNLTRGTGLAGLHGILPKSGNIIRPLIFATKIEIETYAQKNELEWREDSSNNSDKYARNLIRHKVVPVLKELNSNIENTTKQTTGKIKQIEDAFQFEFNIRRETFEVKSGEVVYLNINILLGLPKAYLYKVLEEFGFSFLQADAIFTIISSPFQSGKRFISEYYNLVLDREEIVITKNGNTQSGSVNAFENDTEIEFEGSIFEFSVRSKKDYELLKLPEIGEFDFDKLQFPLEIRNWYDGDIFSPLGLKGKKKLSDFLIDSKVPLNLKSKIKVVVSSGDIIWVAGMRISEKYKITPNTQNILAIKLRS